MEIAYREWYGNQVVDRAAKSAAARHRLPAAGRRKLVMCDKLVEGVGMWLSAVVSAVGGEDTTHKNKPNRPAPKAAVAEPAAALQCQLRGP